MEQETLYKSAYSGTKAFTQQNVKTANATGFGAATDDFMDKGIDLNEILITNKPATFFFKMNSNAMEASGIYCGDVLVVDRSIKPINNNIIVAALDGELLVRRYNSFFKKVSLVPDNKKFKEIIIEQFTDFNCWGVVTYVLHKVN